MYGLRMVQLSLNIVVPVQMSEPMETTTQNVHGRYWSALGSDEFASLTKQTKRLGQLCATCLYTMY